MAGPSPHSSAVAADCPAQRNERWARWARPRLLFWLIWGLCRTPPGRARSKGAKWLTLWMCVSAGLAALLTAWWLPEPIAILPWLLWPVLCVALVCARSLHMLLFVPIVAIAISMASWSALFALATGFERTLIEQTIGLRGAVAVTKYGLDFEEYPELISALQSDPAIRCAVASVRGQGVLGLAVDDDVPEPHAQLELGLDESSSSSQAQGRFVIVEGWMESAARCLPGVARAFGDHDIAASLRAASPGQLPGMAVGHRLASALGLEMGEAVTLLSHRDAALGVGALDGRQAARVGSSSRETEKVRRTRFVVTALLHTGDEELDRTLAAVASSAAQGVFFGRARASVLNVGLHDPSDAAEVAQRWQLRLDAGRARTLYRVHDYTHDRGLRAGINQFRSLVTVSASGLLSVCTAAALAGMLALLRRRQASLKTLIILGLPRASLQALLWTLSICIAVVGTLAGAMIQLVWAAASELYPIQLPLPALGGHRSAEDFIALELAWGLGDWILPPLAMAACLALGTWVVHRWGPQSQLAGAGRD